MLVPNNSREWFWVEKPVHFPICVVLKSDENTFAFNYRRSRCDSMWGFKHMLYIFIYVIMHFYWATFVNIPLHAETDPAKCYAQIRILYGIAQQLMPWLHRTPGHAVVILLIMKIDSEETPLQFTTHFLQFIWCYGFLQKYLHCLCYFFLKYFIKFVQRWI